MGNEEFYTRSTRRGGVIVTGYDEVIKKMSSLLMSDPAMEKVLRKAIKDALRKARNETSKDVHSALPNDPRHAYRAVLHSIYKKPGLFGGDVNILFKKRRGAPTRYIKPRTLKQGQRGGNRMRRSSRTEQLESYGNSDRGFILRFLNGGTDSRHTKYGNRGSINARRMFSRIAPWHVQEAAKEVAEVMKAIIEYKANS